MDGWKPCGLQVRGPVGSKWDGNLTQEFRAQGPTGYR